MSRFKINSNSVRLSWGKCKVSDGVIIMTHYDSYIQMRNVPNGRTGRGARDRDKEFAQFRAGLEKMRQSAVHQCRPHPRSSITKGSITTGTDRVAKGHWLADAIDAAA